MPVNHRALHRIRTCALLLFIAAISLSCVGCPAGPGMITTYSSLIDGRSVSVEMVTLPDGNSFHGPGSVSGGKSADWRWGKTFGGSGDSRVLPEWVDIKWLEPAYPGLQREDFPDEQSFSQAVLAKYSALPTKSQRVLVRERIPFDVVQEAIAARVASPGKLPSKSLWVYFVWTDSGIKFRWSLIEGSSNRLREGGDDL